MKKKTYQKIKKCILIQISLFVCFFDTKANRRAATRDSDGIRASPFDRAAARQTYGRAPDSPDSRPWGITSNSDTDRAARAGPDSDRQPPN